jgi:polyene glycosyltransferase
LFISSSSAGLMNPLLVIASELSRRGVEDVWFATTNDRKADVEAVGGTDGARVRFFSLGEHDAEMDPRFWDDAKHEAISGRSRIGGLAAFLDAIDFDGVQEQHDRIVAALDEISPAVVIADSMVFLAGTEAIARKIPYIVSVAFPISSFYSDLLPWSYPVPLSGLPKDMTFRQKLRNALFRVRVIGVMLRPGFLVRAIAAERRMRKSGLSSSIAQRRRQGEKAAAVLGYSVFDLEYPFPAVPANLTMVGTVVAKEPDSPQDPEGIGAWLSEHDTVVYIAFGTLMRLTRGQIHAIVDAARRLEPRCQVLWKISKAQQRLLPDRLPANLRISEWVPSQHNVLAHPNVKAYFNHAGGNSMHEGLYFGKPLLVVPSWLDAYDFAIRAEDSGAALRIASPADITADTVHEKLSRLLADKTFAERAGYWASRLREAGGVTAAADIVMRAVKEAG